MSEKCLCDRCHRDTWDPFQCPRCHKHFCSLTCADFKESKDSTFLDTCVMCRLEDFTNNDLLAGMLDMLGMSRETAMGLVRGHILIKKDAA